MEYSSETLEKEYLCTQFEECWKIFHQNEAFQKKTFISENCYFYIKQLMNSLSDLNLHKWLVAQSSSLGIKKPTSVQKNCIPQILRGKDVLACAKTGSGKTAAFVLPILQMLSCDPCGLFALVLTPTRELATQIADTFIALGRPISLKVSLITGGNTQVDQIRELETRPHVVVATPGRLSYILEADSTIDFSRLKIFVIDEADRLMSDSFAPDLGEILDRIPTKGRQTLLFSATLTSALEQLLNVTSKEPFIWCSEDINNTVTVSELDQKYILVPADTKDAHFVQLVKNFLEDSPKAHQMMIFVKTCFACQTLSMVLNSLEFDNVPLHSLLKQRHRNSSLARFRNGTVRLLICTDVASRGLDMPSVEHVVNYNVPAQPNDYIHRVGRTARAGRCGRAVTFVTQYDVDNFKAIEQRIGLKMNSDNSIKEADVLPILLEISLAKREAEHRLSSRQFGKRRKAQKMRDQLNLLNLYSERRSFRRKLKSIS